MNYSPLINEVIKLWWALPILLLISILGTSWFKGLFGEVLVKISASLFLPKSTYQRLHNVTLLTPDGTTQIDHIFVSRFGIFVVETKNMKGWIFGDENQAQWTQIIFKKSFKFQNPLRQNYKHLKALEAVLDVPPDSLHSVVVFIGDSTFKTTMPPNVSAGGRGCTSYIKSFSAAVLSDTQVKQVMAQLDSIRLKPSRKVHRQHVQRLKRRADTSTERKCPKCGSGMVLRNARRGKNQGIEFWGCSAYPKCRVAQKC